MRTGPRPPPPQGEPTLKFVMIGDSGVGKSSLLTRFVEDVFSPSFMSTVGIDFKIRTITLNSGGRVKLQIWDTAGQERFRTITSAFYRGAMGAFLVFDVTEKESFLSLPRWLEDVDRFGIDPTVPRILIGNKCDLVAKRIVGEAEAKVFAAEHGYMYAETSANSGKNVQDVFVGMAEKVWARLHEKVEAEVDVVRVDVVHLEEVEVEKRGPNKVEKKCC